MKLVEAVNQGISICLVGEFGIGKTHLLNRLSKEFNTPVLSSNPGINELEQLLDKRFKSKKDAFNELLKAEKRVLLFDDVHESRKDTVSAMLKLCRKHVLVCSSEQELERLEFDFKNLRLKKLDYEDSMKLCMKYCSGKAVCERICEQSKGLPLLIIRGAEYYKVTGSVKKYFNFEWKKTLFKRLSVAAYLFLSLRYFAMFNNNWEFYSVLSTIAYALLAFNKMSKRI